MLKVKQPKTKERKKRKQIKTEINNKGHSFVSKLEISTR